MHVDADLVGASGLDAHFDQRERAVLAGDAFEDMNVGDGGSAIGATGGHSGSANDVASDGEGDRDVVFLKVTVDKSEIGL